MPLYEYACEGCGQEVTLLQSIHATASDTVCPHCRQTRLVRHLSSFAARANGDSRMPAERMASEATAASGGGCGCTPSTCGCG